MSYDKVIDSSKLDAYLTSVADAIRTKSGTTGKLTFPDGFVSAVEEIQPLKLQDKTVTENGEYTADAGYDGLGKVTVEVAGSGGSSNDVRYVTFMSYDGLIEYGKKAVAVGDDCADPIARGVFDTPTRESDAQYSYTFYGWATTPNGAAVSSALKAVEEDRTVYANFASAVRYYTITYLDTDGSVLKTESLAYGSMPPAYTPEKDGYSFSGWSPSLATVTGNTSYTAMWIEAVTFAGSSLSKISEIAEAGNATEYFSVGDSRVIPVTIGGITYNFTAKIVDFNIDEKEDGTRAGISCMFFTVPETPYTYGSSIGKFENSTPYIEAVKFATEYLPVELRDVLKAVKKEWNNPYSSSTVTRYEKTWIPSALEIGKSSAGSNGIDHGTKYAAFSKYYYTYTYDNSTKVFDTAGINKSKVWLRDANKYDSGALYLSNGNVVSAANSNVSNVKPYLGIGFCI